MRRFRVAVSPAAEQDAADAFRFIAERSSPAAAERWLAAVEATLNSLDSLAERFPIAREDRLIDGDTLRCAVVHSHRILFTIRDDRVLVLRLRHGARQDLEQLSTDG